LWPKPPSGYQVVFLCDRKSFFLKPIDGHKWFFCLMTFFSSQSESPSDHQVVFFLWFLFFLLLVTKTTR
jgi:hypothetical protein